MNCSQAAPLLSQYFDDSLDTTKREQVRAHLAGCAACAARLAAYQRMETRLADAMTVKARPGFRQSVLAATSHQSNAQPPVYTRRLGRRRSQMLFGGLAGGSVAVLAIVLFALVANSPSMQHARPKNLVASRPNVSPTVWHTIRPRLVNPVKHHHLATSILIPSTTVSVLTTPIPIQSRPTNVPSQDLTATVATHGPPVVTVDHAAAVHLVRQEMMTAGAVHSPLWSPDSTSLLYLTGWGVHCRGKWYCGTLNLHTPHGTIQLATHVRSFSWSPDGQSVAYAADSASGSGLLLPESLHVVQLDGSGDRVLCGADHTNIEWLDLGIVAARNGTVVSVSPQSGAYAALAGLPKMTLADDQKAFFAVSEDGRYFAYQDRSGLRVWARDKGAQLVFRQPLTRFLESSFHFSWDGTTLFYSTFDGRYTKLYRKSLASRGNATALNNNTPLPGPINLVGSPSPDGSIVAFRIGSGASAQNYVIDSRHGLAHTLLPPGGVGPVGWWSPDGRRLVYMVYQGDTAKYAAIASVSY
jgi:hypothetical protein